MTGKFITFEGGEGSGKSTQLKLLASALEKAELPFISTREPGGSKGAESIRNLLVNGDVDAWDAETETLLFYAARLDHVHTLVKPALLDGKIVICDRFSDSTKVYQGIGKKVSDNYINSLHHLILGDFMPHLTIILDIDHKAGLARASQRALAIENAEDRFEKMDITFHENIRAGFLAIAKAEPERCVVLDAAQDKDVLHSQILQTIAQRLQLAL